MALITCKECKKQVSDSAKTCPSCGAPVPKPTSRLAIFIAGFFGLIVFSTIYRSTTNTPQAVSAPVTQIAQTSTRNPTDTQSAPEKPATKEWEYFNESDSMTGKTNQFATLTSDNSLDLSFPYKGKNHGILMIRQTKGTDVIFSIEQGQMLCSSYSGCSITVRFDDNPPQKFNANEPADHSKTYLFVNDTARFINAAKKAKSIKVQPLLFQQGAQVLEFSTPVPLMWPKK
jgi:hypothetical protein